MKKIILLATLLSAPTYATDKYGREWESDCDSTQLGMNTCAKREYDKIDARLNELYKKKMNSLSKDGFYRKALQDSQIAWVGFKTKDCAYQLGPIQYQGSMSQYSEFTCMYIHTKRRVQDLEEYIECTDNGCPI